MSDAIDIQVQLQEKWLIFWWALIFSMVSLGAAWHKGLFNPFSSSRFPHIKGKDVCTGFALFLVMEIVLIPLVAGFIFTLNGSDGNLKGEDKGWISLLLVLGGFVAALLAFSFLTSEQRKQLWQQDTNSWVHHFGMGIACWFVFFPVVLAFSQILSIVLWHLLHHPFHEQSAVINMREAMKNPYLFATLALAIVTVVPFTEEFLFRGLLQTWLKQKFGRAWPAIMLSSLIFSLFHFTAAQGFTNIELLSSLFLLSCVLGYIFERQHSLWASIGLHSFFNFMSLLMIMNQ